MKNQEPRRANLHILLVFALLLLAWATRPGVAQIVSKQLAADVDRTALIEAFAAAKLAPTGEAPISPDLQAALKAAFEQEFATNSESDPDQVIDNTMQGARLQLEKELAVLAQKVKSIEDAKLSVRNALAEVRDAMAEGAYSGGVAYTEPDGKEVTNSFADKEELEEILKQLEDRLNGIGDDAQLAQIDLQQALQKQNQVLQLMSNIVKYQHDTMMSIIRKME